MVAYYEGNLLLENASLNFITELSDEQSNCWEFKKCGRQAGGHRAKELGICPVTTYIDLSGAHGGMNAGRACWVVAGSLCGVKVQGEFAQKLGNC